jgi:hypothetical protein
VVATDREGLRLGNLSRYLAATFGSSWITGPSLCATGRPTAGPVERNCSATTCDAADRQVTRARLHLHGHGARRPINELIDPIVADPQLDSNVNASDPGLIYTVLEQGPLFPYVADPTP